MSTMIAAGRRVGGMETRVSCVSMRGTPTYTVTSKEAFVLLMRYADSGKIDALPVLYDEGVFIGVFILWCDALVTAYDTLTGRTLQQWCGDGARGQEVA